MENLGHQSGDLSRERSDGQLGGPLIWRDDACKGPFTTFCWGFTLPETKIAPENGGFQ